MWKENFKDVSRLERVPKATRAAMIRKTTQLPAGQTYRREGTRGIKRKNLPAASPVTAGCLCPNCYQRRIEKLVD
jgi:hypothetical protein